MARRLHRIAIDARSVLDKKSGIGNYVAALLRHLVPMAEDMQFLLLRHPSAREPIIEHSRATEIRLGGETKSMRTVFRLGREHDFSRYDLYHGPADLIPLGVGCRWVVTIHDLMWFEAPALASAFLPVRVANGLWYRSNIRRAVRGAERVIAISEATRAAMGRVFPDHVNKVHVVHHGIDPAVYAAARAGPRSLLDRWLSPAERYSLIVGQGSPYKNHLGMVAAFVEATRDDPAHKLVLVRRFSRIDRAMSSLLARPDVAARVIAIPSVTDLELLTLYRHAHMFLFASHCEGFGLPALEAMSLGTPVLGSRAPAVAEIAGDAALLAEPSSHGDLVAKLRALDRDTALRQRLIRAGAARVAQFTWPAAAERTLSVYRDALAVG
ncbi:MAG: glycosyltransferase family 4 protein [Polyangiaceae bacterium]|nr:glycosyltransferase family 4 protein [Polyangiaceae bacterium]